jgi:hypothetical protein
MTENNGSTRQLRMAVAIATTGRREVLAKTIEILAHQTCLPASLIICPVKDSDVDVESLKRFPAPTRIVTGAMGLAAQRNLLLSAAADADIIIFFTMIFLPSATISQTSRPFLSHIPTWSQ